VVISQLLFDGAADRGDKLLPLGLIGRAGPEPVW